MPYAVSPGTRTVERVYELYLGGSWSRFRHPTHPQTTNINITVEPLFHDSPTHTLLKVFVQGRSDLEGTENISWRVSLLWMSQIDLESGTCRSKILLAIPCQFFFLCEHISIK